MEHLNTGMKFWIFENIYNTVGIHSKTYTVMQVRIWQVSLAAYWTQQKEGSGNYAAVKLTQSEAWREMTI